MKKLKNKSKGQILPLVALTVLVLSMFSFLVWNLGMLEFNRQKMQTAADAAALSAVRCRAAFQSTISLANFGTHAMTMYMFHNIKEGGMLKTMKTPYKTYVRTFLTSFNQINGAAPSLAGRAAARANGATGIPVWGMPFRTQLVKRNMKFTLFKLVTLPIVGTVPVPVGRWTARPAYYCRGWEDAFRKAQMHHEMTWYAYKSNVTFASSLIGLSRPSRAQASAQAQTYLNVRENVAFDAHNGGFPRNKSEGIWGMVEPVSLYPQFDARLVPVTRPIPMLAH